MKSTRFRPCIDIHQGQVKQIVGGTLSAADPQLLQTNAVSALPASYFAQLYRKHGLVGAHVIMLGPGCVDAATSAVEAWPNQLQVGGGVNATNAQDWISRGASHVILTSYLFPDARFSLDRLQEVSRLVGREHVVIDLSCRKQGTGWTVAMNKWQTLTETHLSAETFSMMKDYCAEFLVHAADVEGLCRGIDEELVERLGEWAELVDRPITYAGGGKDVSDLALVNRLSKGRVDLTIGSALDIFGGSAVTLDSCVKWNVEHQ